MESNIIFESNIYPVNGSIISDKAYLSNIWDYNRLYSIDKRYYHNVPWTEFQKKIIREQPTCALNKSDPCWGMVKHGEGYSWVCMCTKADCPHFEVCRSSNPFDPEAEEAFIPRFQETDEYGYEQFISNYYANPVLVGDNTEYGKAPESKRNRLITSDQIIVETSAPSPFAELIRLQEPVTQQGGEEYTEKEIIVPNISDIGQSSTEEVHKYNAAEVDVISEKDLYSKDFNIFDYFSECSQSDVIRASHKASFFVDAGPGTGKTYTLIQKLNYLVSEEGVEADGILVLCFTNAAVDEIKSRLRDFVRKGADRSLVNVDIRTFHSFAWWLINQANTVLSNDGWNPIPMMNLTYESSLLQASQIISRFGKDVVGNWEYFIVDEVQDLTNTLGRFVLKIVNACLNVSCGVTVLGDACQAIYDYDQETTSPLKSKEFYQALFRQMIGKADFVYLTGNHRQNNDLIELTSGMRDAILSDDNEEMFREVTKFSSVVPHDLSSGASINSSFIEKNRTGRTVSLLLRNNGQTLKMSSDLRKRGVPHTLNITETKDNYAPWISDVFCMYIKPMISEDVFSERYPEGLEFDSTAVWERLQRLMHTDNDVLSVRELLDAIAKSRIDDPILRSSHIMDTVVSNIHRAKGREYDSVIIDNSFVESFSPNTPAEEFKTLYVAMTRPKSRLLLANLQDKTGMKIISIFDTNRKRWGKTKNKKIAYFEFDSAKDLDNSIFAKVSPKTIASINIGDPVCLKRILGKGNIGYSIIHEPSDETLGNIGESSAFVRDLEAYMRIDKSSFVEMPSEITDLYVSGIYSQVVDQSYLDLHPEIKEIAPNGVWKWVELVGIGHADYDIY